MAIELGGFTASVAQSYTQLGYRDYIGARTLLRAGQLYQGAVLASTAVEKYLKAILLIFGKKGRGHLDRPDILKMFKACGSGLHLVDILNHEFIEFLGRAYRLRYVDDVKTDLSLGVEQYKVLAELDFSINQIELRIARKQGNDVLPMSPYKNEWSVGDANLCGENYVLLGSDKELFVQRKQKFFGLCVNKDLIILELSSDEVRPLNDGVFSKPHLSFKSPNEINIEFSGPGVAEGLVP